MRNLLLQQLMDQHTTKARREKILKALIALGISEVEYQKLIAKLGEMDAAKLAEQTAARTKVAEPIAMTVEAPAMRESSPEISEKPEVAPTESRAQTTRAALYKRLKEEAATARK
jgi:predicted regulator of amino acid metabolism with ACT domain